jgi:hypothetical protein
MPDWEEQSPSVAMARALQPMLSNNISYSTITTPATYTAANTIAG